LANGDNTHDGNSYIKNNTHNAQHSAQVLRHVSSFFVCDNIISTNWSNKTARLKLILLLIYAQESSKQDAIKRYSKAFSSRDGGLYRNVHPFVKTS